MHCGIGGLPIGTQSVWITSAADDCAIFHGTAFGGAADIMDQFIDSGQSIERMIMVGEGSGAMQAPPC